MSSKDFHSLIICCPDLHISLLFPGSGNCPFHLGSSRSHTETAHKQSSLLQLFHASCKFVFSYPFPCLFLPHLKSPNLCHYCMEIIPSFPHCSYPFLSIFQFFQTHLGNGRSQMSNTGSHMQPRYRFIHNEVLCSLFLLICLFLTATENWAEAMVEPSTTNTRSHSWMVTVCWEPIIFYMK